MKTDLLPYLQTVPSAVFPQDSVRCIWCRRYISSVLNMYHFFVGLHTRPICYLSHKSGVWSRDDWSTPAGTTDEFSVCIEAGQSARRHLESLSFHATLCTSHYLRSWWMHQVLCLPHYLQVCIADHLRPVS